MALTISFAGKRILVTGGGGGLGKAVAKKLYDDGATVFAVDKQQSLLDELKKECPKITTVTLDLTNFEETKKVVESFLPLHHLVNNAGISGKQSFLDIDVKTLKNVFDVNLNSYVVVGQTVAKGMIKHKIEGSIVNVASVTCVRPYPTIGSYCCSKAAVAMLTKIMALELGEHNIRVNAISPAAIDTPMLAPPPEMTQEEIKGRIAFALERNIIKRFIKPQEAADLILFLLSPTASMITGENVFIDAGSSIS